MPTINELYEIKESKVNDRSQVKNKQAITHNIFVKQMDFSGPNSTYCGHHHEYDHVTLVASGRVRVKFSAVPAAGIPEEEAEYSAVTMFITRAFRTHEITALEPNTTVCCVHALRTEDGEIYQPDVPREYVKGEINQEPSFRTPSGIRNPLAFNGFADSELKKYDKILRTAEKEGTLEPGSQDRLIN